MEQVFVVEQVVFDVFDFVVDLFDHVEGLPVFDCVIVNVACVGYAYDGAVGELVELDGHVFVEFDDAWVAFLRIFNKDFI